MPRLPLRLSLLALCAVARSAAGAVDTPPPDTLRVQRVEIIDRQSFEKPMLAATMMVPAGWRHEGGVAWNMGAKCVKPYSLTLRAQSADGSGAIELLPGEAWSSDSTGRATGGCPAGSFSDPNQFLRNWVERHRPGARWLEYRARPDLFLEGAYATLPGGYVRNWIESGQALIGYPRDGREIREVLAVAISFSRSQSNYHGGRMTRSLSGESLGVLSWRAPEAQFDPRHFDALWQTLRPADEWTSRVIAKRFPNVAKMRELETERGSNIGDVALLLNHYRNVWQLRDGTYLLTDSPTFDPERDLGIAGEQVTR